VQDPPTQSIASRVVAKPACISVRVCSEPGSARIQAASSSLENKQIVDEWILQGRIKPTFC
jgi:hypothetical protein